MSVEENKAVARKYCHEVWNSGNVDLLDEFYILDQPPADDYRQKLKQNILWWHSVAPGLKFTILDMIAEGDRVVIYFQADVTYSVLPDPQSTYPMPPFGKPVSWKVVNIMRIVDGKIVAIEYAGNYWMAMLVDEGVIPLPKPEGVNESR
jgi:predicted ester cyclase